MKNFILTMLAAVLIPAAYAADDVRTKTSIGVIDPVAAIDFIKVSSQTALPAPQPNSSMDVAMDYGIDGADRTFGARDNAAAIYLRRFGFIAGRSGSNTAPTVAEAIIDGETFSLQINPVLSIAKDKAEIEGKGVSLSMSQTKFSSGKHIISGNSDGGVFEGATAIVYEQVKGGARITGPGMNLEMMSSMAENSGNYGKITGKFDAMLVSKKTLAAVIVLVLDMKSYY